MLQTSMAVPLLMINRYDPFDAPAPGDWLDLDETERIDLVQRYHRRARIRLPNARVHAAFHVIVENQIALGEQTVLRTAQRLLAEGLNRHEVIHAIGSVLAGHLFDLTRQSAPSTPEADDNQRYNAALERLTADNWREN